MNEDQKGVASLRPPASGSRGKTRADYLAEVGASKCYRHNGEHALIECSDSSLAPEDRTEADNAFDAVMDEGAVSNDRIMKALAHGIPSDLLWRIARDFYVTGWYDGSGKDVRTALEVARRRQRERELYEAAMNAGTPQAGSAAGVPPQTES